MQNKTCTNCHSNRFYSIDCHKYYCDNCHQLYRNPNLTQNPNQEEETNEIQAKIRPRCPKTLPETRLFRKIDQINSISSIQRQLAQIQQQEVLRLKDHLTCARLRRNDAYERAIAAGRALQQTRITPISEGFAGQGREDRHELNPPIHFGARGNERSGAAGAQVRFDRRADAGPDWAAEPEWQLGGFGNHPIRAGKQLLEQSIQRRADRWQELLDYLTQAQTDQDEICRWEDEGGRIGPTPPETWKVYQIKNPFRSETLQLSSRTKAKRAEEVRKFFASRAITMPSNVVTDDDVLEFATAYQMMGRAFR
jgi:hypothetical protein